MFPALAIAWHVHPSVKGAEFAQNGYTDCDVCPGMDAEKIRKSISTSFAYCADHLAS